MCRDYEGFYISCFVCVLVPKLLLEQLKRLYQTVCSAEREACVSDSLFYPVNTMCLNRLCFVNGIAVHRHRFIVCVRVVCAELSHSLDVQSVFLFFSKTCSHTQAATHTHNRHTHARFHLNSNLTAKYG